MKEELDLEFLKVLVCPQCKGALELSAEKDVLKCTKCQLGYPIREGIPVMLVDEAVALKNG